MRYFLVVALGNVFVVYPRPRPDLTSVFVIHCKSRISNMYIKNHCGFQGLLNPSNSALAKYDILKLSRGAAHRSLSCADGRIFDVFTVP